MTTSPESSEKSSQHTPGPWRIGGSGIQILAGEEPFYHVASAMRIATDKPMVEANARLIAAAPDLLDACGMIAEWLEAKQEPTEQDKVALRVVNRALAIAEGRST